MRRKKHKKSRSLLPFFLKTMIFSLTMFLMTSTFVLAFISKDVNGVAYSDYSTFSGRGGIRATSTRLAVSGQAVTSDMNTSYGVYGYSLTNAYVQEGDGNIVGDAVGVYGDARADNGYPVSGGNVYGVWGNAKVNSDYRANATGVYGKISDDEGSSKNAFGIRGEVYDKMGVGEGNYYGVYGLYQGDGRGFGVYGEVSEGGYEASAIYGRASDNNYAGYFDGKLKVKGDLILDSSEKNSNVCSVEGSIYYNVDISEMCFCNGANWMRVASPKDICK